MNTLAPTLQAFFTDRLARQRQVSGHTITAYRDAFKLLLAFAEQQTGKPPSRPDIADLDAPLIGAFLNHLETDRGNSARTRNARLAAIHSLFRYAALRHPEDAAVIQRVLAIPPKRFDRVLITYLTEEEITALLAAPDQATWTGRRDHALLMPACQTGLRATELTQLTIGDVHLGTGAHVSCLGKGRKQRITPLTATTAAVVAAWLAERAGLPADPAVRHPPRHSAEPGRPGKAHHQAHGHRRAVPPSPAREEGLAPRFASLRRDAFAQRWRRHLGHRVVDGARERGNHAGLHPCRPGSQGTGDCPDRAARRSARPLPAARRRAGVPRQPVIMPSIRSRERSPPATHHRWPA